MSSDVVGVAEIPLSDAGEGLAGDAAAAKPARASSRDTRSQPSSSPLPNPVPPDFILRPRQISKATFPIREAPPKDDAVEHPEASQEVGEKVRELKGETRTDAQQAGAVVHIGPGGP